MIREVVITGMGALTPIGNNLNNFWEGLQTGKSGAGPITRFNAEKFKTRFACELKGFKAEDHFNRREQRTTDPYTQYALVAVDEAVNHAAIDFEALNRNRIGVIWGSGNGGIYTFQEQVTEFALGDGTPRYNPFLIPKMIVDIAAGIISIKYGLRGPNYATVSACATSSTAIIDAFNLIRWGKADVMITGGSEAPIVEASVGGFNASRALSTRNDTPHSASRPFDVDRDGFVMGEGAGALVLESKEHAEKRGANIIAKIVGTGMAADAYHLTGTHPEGEGALLGMQEALREAELAPSDLDYINLHATSTPVGDPSELKAVERLYNGKPAPRMSATKSMTGHLLGAAGAVEAIASTLAVQYGCIPPTINTRNLDPELPGDIDITMGTAVHAPVNYAMSNTFGFGGHIASLIVGKA